MISIAYTVSNHRYCIRSEGHAGYYPGNDPVCAAVSAILWTLAGGLENLTEDSKWSADVRKGRFSVSCHPAEEDLPAVDTMFDMTVIGLMLVEKKYPGYVEVRRGQEL